MPELTHITSRWSIGSAGWRGLWLLLPALLILLGGCRPPAPPRAGWVRLAALRPLHPAQAMLDDLERRLAALGAERAQLLDAPLPPLPPEVIRYDTAPLDALPAPEVSATPAAQAPAREDLQVLRDRLERAGDRQERRLRQELSAEYDAGLAATRAALAHQRDERRRALAEQFRERLVNADLRRKLVLNEAAQARADADYAEVAAELERADARVDAELAAAQEEATQALQVRRTERLQRWRAAQGATIAAAVAERAAVLQADADARPAEAAPAPLPLPAIDTRPLHVESGEMRIAVHRAGTAVTGQRLQSIHTLDDTVHRLTLQRIALEREIDDDTRAAARALALQHNWHLVFDTPRGKDLTADVTTWLSGYWPADAPR